jgi:hypothetical protein
MGRIGTAVAAAEMRGGLAWTKGGLAASQHEQRHGNAGRRGRPAAEMRPADVQSTADQRGRTHSRWEARDKQPKGLRGTHTHAESSQPARGNRGPRRPGDRQTGKGCQRAKWGTRPRTTTLALAMYGSLGRAPRLHAILKDWADERVNDTQFRSDTETGRHQHGSPRVESSQTLPIRSGNVRVPAPGGGQPYA